MLCCLLSGCSTTPISNIDLTIKEYDIELTGAPEFDRDLFLGPEIIIDYELFEI